MTEARLCCVHPGDYAPASTHCATCLACTCWTYPGASRAGGLRPGYGLVVETAATESGCPSCGVIAEDCGRRLRTLRDIPTFVRRSSWAGANAGTTAPSRRARRRGSARSPTWLSDGLG